MACNSAADSVSPIKVDMPFDGSSDPAGGLAAASHCPTPPQEIVDDKISCSVDAPSEKTLGDVTVELAEPKVVGVSQEPKTPAQAEKIERRIHFAMRTLVLLVLYIIFGLLILTAITSGNNGPQNPPDTASGQPSASEAKTPTPATTPPRSFYCTCDSTCHQSTANPSATPLECATQATVTVPPTPQTSLAGAEPLKANGTASKEQASVQTSGTERKAHASTPVDVHGAPIDAATNGNLNATSQIQSSSSIPRGRLVLNTTHAGPAEGKLVTESPGYGGKKHPLTALPNPPDSNSSQINRLPTIPEEPDESNADNAPERPSAPAQPVSPIKAPASEGTEQPSAPIRLLPEPMEISEGSTNKNPPSSPIRMPHGPIPIHEEHSESLPAKQCYPLDITPPPSDNDQEDCTIDYTKSTPPTKEELEWRSRCDSGVSVTYCSTSDSENDEQVNFSGSSESSSPILSERRPRCSSAPTRMNTPETINKPLITGIEGKAAVQRRTPSDESNYISSLSSHLHSNEESTSKEQRTRGFLNNQPHEGSPNQPDLLSDLVLPDVISGSNLPDSLPNLNMSDVISNLPDSVPGLLDLISGSPDLIQSLPDNLPGLLDLISGLSDRVPKLPDSVPSLPDLIPNHPDSMPELPDLVKDCEERRREHLQQQATRMCMPDAYQVENNAQNNHALNVPELAEGQVPFMRTRMAAEHPAYLADPTSQSGRNGRQSGFFPLWAATESDQGWINDMFGHTNPPNRPVSVNTPSTFESSPRAPAQPSTKPNNVATAKRAPMRIHPGVFADLEVIRGERAKRKAAEETARKPIPNALTKEQKTMINERIKRGIMIRNNQKSQSPPQDENDKNQKVISCWDNPDSIVNVVEENYEGEPALRS